MALAPGYGETPVSQRETIALRITKQEAAVSQLDTAIDLYFRGGHEVATHTLAGAAFSLIQDLLEHQGREEFLESVIISDRRRELRQLLNKPQNFLKHADRDPEDVLELSAAQTEAMLFLASLQIELIDDDGRSDRVAIFQFWFAVNHPDLLVDGPGKRNVEEWLGRNEIVERTDFYAQAVEIMPSAWRLHFASAAGDKAQLAD